MSVERGIRYELLARLCPNATGADIRSVCTEAGMFAIRERRKVPPSFRSRLRCSWFVVVALTHGS
jgi:SpoVK/Ycf46/Vps4 family AAA+-type ATPase